MRQFRLIMLIVVFSILQNTVSYSQKPLRVVDKRTNTEVSYEQVNRWQDGTAMNDTKVDGVIYLKNNGNYYKREIGESISVKWFGAKGDGKTDDTKAFEDMFSYLAKLKNNTRVFIPNGEYVIKKKLIIKGENNLPIIQGAGMRNTILNFSQSKDDCCLQLGERNINSLNGGIIDLQVRGSGKNDGLRLFGTAPYVVAWCRFENLYFSNVSNGILDDKSITCYSSHFSNIHIEKYFETGMVINGGYNTYKGIFIVQPSGQTNVDNPDSKLGARNLALNIIGGNNSFYDVQSEDQIKIVGGYNTFNGLVIEHIMKGQVNSEIQKTAIWVGGANTLFNKLKIVGLKSNRVDYLMRIFSPNVTIMNAMYEDMSRKDMKVSYPFYPSAESSGVMINCIPKTVFGLDHPAFLNDTRNWTFINVMGENDKIFSRIKNDGFKISTQDRNKLQPEEGMQIYNTTTHDYEFWNGKQWKSMSK